MLNLASALTYAAAGQGDSGRVQIKFISRPKGPNNSRAVLNEAEIVETLQERYGLHADVSLILFNYMTLSEAMVAMNYTDILIGVHGAGNAFALQRKRSWRGVDFTDSHEFYLTVTA